MKTKPETRRLETERFLKALDPTAASWTFQTFDDDDKRDDQNLVRVLNGTLAKHWSTLVRLNKRGAGIFVTVNETDLKGRTEKNIIRVRALFCDLDGAPLEPVLANGKPPHIVTATSPGRWHTYWRVTDFPLAQFTDTQKALSELYGGDPKVSDLPRVMRLPGFLHCKGKPFLSHIVSTNDAAPYKSADFPQAQPKNYFTEYARITGSSDQTNEWRQLNSEALGNLSAWAPKLFPEARPYRGGYRVTSKMLKRELQEDLSLMPGGIKDFGVHDMGDKREGKRTPIDIVMEWGKKDFNSAVDWLREALRKDEESQNPEPKLSTLPLQWHGDAPPQPPKWMIRNRLPETGAGLLIGQWGMLKTFAMLDISVHVMLGWDWTGEPVYRRAGVLCLAQEGGESIAARLAAITKHKIKSEKRLPFAWSNSCPKLLGKEDPLPLLLNTAKLVHERFMQEHNLPLGLIWIDTMSSSAGWEDESDNAEAARVMGTLRSLSRQTGAVVAGVDHLGKNIEAGARGASSKEANSDFLFAMLGKKDLSGQISDTRLALRKVREG
jgi:hypothetical protein